LGERLDRTQEVASSSLASSIEKDPAQAGFFLFGATGTYTTAGQAAVSASRTFVLKK
jgi:hypothetical protein